MSPSGSKTQIEGTIAVASPFDAALHAGEPRREHRFGGGIFVVEQWWH